MKILFDSLSVQVQVQNQVTASSASPSGYTRLQTLFGALTAAGYSYSFSDPTKPLSSQLAGYDVLVILTRYKGIVPSTKGDYPLPAGITSQTTWSFPPGDVEGIVDWVQGGGGLLLMSNHNYASSGLPYAGWAIFDMTLASALGVTICPAAFGPPSGSTYLQMGPYTGTAQPIAPPALVHGVQNIQAFDGCGIQGGNWIFAIPSGCQDTSGFGYQASDCAFATQIAVGAGNAIVVGHSGMVGDPPNANTPPSAPSATPPFGFPWPAQGEIGQVQNQTFLMNCIAFLGAASASARAGTVTLPVPANTTINVVGCTNAGWVERMVVTSNGTTPPSPGWTWSSPGNAKNQVVGNGQILPTAGVTSLTVQMSYSSNGSTFLPSQVEAVGFQAPGLAGFVVGGQDGGGRPNGPAYGNTVLWVYWTPGY